MLNHNWKLLFGGNPNNVGTNFKNNVALAYIDEKDVYVIIVTKQDDKYIVYFGSISEVNMISEKYLPIPPINRDVVFANIFKLENKPIINLDSYEFWYSAETSDKYSIGVVLSSLNELINLFIQNAD